MEVKKPVATEYLEAINPKVWRLAARLNDKYIPSIFGIVRQMQLKHQTQSLRKQGVGAGLIASRLCYTFWQGRFQNCN